jgi:hypothetical protein
VASSIHNLRHKQMSPIVGAHLFMAERVGFEPT